jgi:hypothetical protein
MIMLKLYKLILVLFVILSLGNLFAQARNAEYEIHKRGKLWETMKDDGTIGAPDPTDRFEYYPSMDWPGGPEKLEKDDQRSYMVGAGTWIGGKRSDGSIFFVENGPNLLVDQGTFEKIEKMENYIENPDYNPAEAEEIITAKWTTTENISVKRVSRAWSFREVNNLIIIEYTFTNEGSSGLTEVYFGFPYLIRPSYQDFVVHNGWGDDFNRTDEYVRYDEKLKLLYAWDDTPNFSLPNDVGNYYAKVDELRTPGYAGYALLYNDPVDDGSEQPANVLYAQLLNNERFLTLQSNTKENLYKILNGEDQSLQAGQEDHLTPFMLMSVGPYTLNPGESVNIVLVEAVDGISIEDAVKGIEAQKLLPQGEEMLKTTIENAKNLFANNYQVQDIPPPAPDIEIIAIPETQSISISWKPIEGKWIDPLENKGNFLEYRIYRSDRSFIGPFKQLRSIKPSRVTDVNRYYNAQLDKWVYEDRTINLGAGYFYAVTSVDSNGTESWLTNRNTKPIFATRTPAENTLNVKVFPNPFKKVSGFPISGQENSIVWTNLPEKCTIRIYTSNGELVKELEHNNSASGEEKWDQLSDSRQRTAPGIYFWTVESEVGTSKGTLLIIK